MKDVKVEWTASWECPICGGLTDQCDETDDWFDNGDSIDVICHHEVENQDGEWEDCAAKYTVDLRS